MSPRFTVGILAGRSLSIEIDADNADAAEAIARYLFEANPEAFIDFGQEIVDLEVGEPEREGGR